MVIISAPNSVKTLGAIIKEAPLAQSKTILYPLRVNFGGRIFLM